MNECGPSVGAVLGTAGLGLLGVLGVLALLWKVVDVWRFFRQKTLSIVDRVKQDKKAGSSNSGTYVTAVWVLAVCVAVLAIALILMSNM